MAFSPVTPSDLKALLPSSTATLCAGFVKSLLQFPVAIYKIFVAILDSDGNLSAAFLNAITPAGDLKWSGVVTPATGWLLCDGSPVSRTTYAPLFTAVGTQYGPGDGVNTFNLPDMRARFLVGVGTFESGATIAVGETGGEEKHVLDGTELNHQHAFGKMESDAGASGDNGVFAIGTSIPALTGNGRAVKGVNGSPITKDFATLTGTDFVTKGVITNDPTTITGHNNLPPYMGAYCFIKT